jgi:hypothetical protein
MLCLAAHYRAPIVICVASSLICDMSRTSARLQAMKNTVTTVGGDYYRQAVL